VPIDATITVYAPEVFRNPLIEHFLVANYLSSGSGVISSDSRILTNAHVVSTI